MTIVRSAMLDALVGDPAIARHFTDAADLAAMLAFEAALAAAQAECGLIPPAAAAAITIACAAFQPDWSHLCAGMAADGVPGPAFVAALRETLDPAHRDWLHYGATSQDVTDTSLTMRLKLVVAELDARLAAVTATLDQLGADQGGTILMGRTRMRRALPITASDKLNAWTRPLLRHEQRLRQMAPRVLVIQFGGPVGTRDRLGGRSDAVAAALAARLGLGNAPSWHTGRDAVVEFGHWLAMLCGSLGKIGADAAILSQDEVGALRLSGGGRSSAMPHKANPVAAEILVALARFTAALSGGLGTAMVAENERSGAAWTLEWMLLPTLAEAAAAALGHVGTLLDRLRFLPDP